MPEIDTHLERSVLPLFVPKVDRIRWPSRAGSCVLVTLFGRHFMVTAKHVVSWNGRLIDGENIHLASRGSKLFRFPVHGFYAAHHLDVAVVVLNPQHVTELTRRGFVFIPERFIQTGSAHLSVCSPNHVIVYGWPESNTQFHVDPTKRNIKQKSFLFLTQLANFQQPLEDQAIDPATHLLLAFNPDVVTVNGNRAKVPNPTGISGGAAFYVIDGTVILAGIMTDSLKSSCAMAAVKMSEVADVARYALQQE
jgi:hypothetical protein